MGGKTLERGGTEPSATLLLLHIGTCGVDWVELPPPSVAGLLDDSGGWWSPREVPFGHCSLTVGEGSRTSTPEVELPLLRGVELPRVERGSSDWRRPWRSQVPQNTVVLGNVKVGGGFKLMPQFPASRKIISVSGHLKRQGWSATSGPRALMDIAQCQTQKGSGWGLLGPVE